MYTLIVDCSPIALEHAVYVVNQKADVIERAYLPTAEIAGFATRIPEVKKIALSGPTEYCFGIGEEIGNQLITEYSNNNIEIEVL